MRRFAVYDVPFEKLTHYTDGIYLLDDDAAEPQEIGKDKRAHFVSGFFELSTVEPFNNLSRMLLLLERNETSALFKNKEFKITLVALALQKTLELAAPLKVNQENYDYYLQKILPFIRREY